MTMPTHTPRRAAGCPQPSGHLPRPAAPGRMRTHGVCPRCGGTIGRGRPFGLGTLLRRGLSAPVRYLRAAPLPHATGGVSALIGAGLARVALEALAEEALSLGLLLFMPASGWFGLALLCGADGMSRYREYLRVRRMLDRWGYTPRLLRPLASSRCQRDAAMQAARETGCADRARAYYRELGYRWYHLLPDKVTANPLTFLDIGFLRATFLPGKR